MRYIFALLALFVPLSLLGAEPTIDPDTLRQPDRVVNATDEILRSILNGFEGIYSSDTSIGMAIKTLLVVLIVFKAIIFYYQYVKLEQDLADLFPSILQVACTIILMTSYTSWTWAMYQFFANLGESFGMALFQTKDPNTLDAVMTSIAGVVITGDGWFGIDFTVLLVEFCIFILSTFQFLAMGIASWGSLFTIAVGYIFIPFILTKQTYPIFEAWLKLFFSFTLFSFFVSVVIALVTMMLIVTLFGAPLSVIGGDTFHAYANLTIEVKSFREYSGLFLMTIVAIFSLLKTYNYASQIAGGLSGQVASGGRVASNAVSKSLFGKGD